MHGYHCNLTEFKFPLVTAERKHWKIHHQSHAMNLLRYSGEKKKTFIPGLDKTRGDCQSKTNTKIHILQYILDIYIFSVSEPSKDTGPNT